MSSDAHNSTLRSRIAVLLAFATAVLIGVLVAVLLGGLITANA